MLLGIDHVVIAVADPDAAVATLAAHLGLDPGGGGSHDTWGTRNRLLWLGDSYVELLGIEDLQLAADSWLGGPAVATRAAWPALIGWAIASDDLDADALALQHRGAQLGRSIPGERRRPDGASVRWRLALPPRISLDSPFLIEHPSTSAEWTARDRAIRAAQPGRLIGLDLPVDAVTGLSPGAAVIGQHRVASVGAGEAPMLHVEAPSRARRTRLLGCDWVVR